MRAGGDVKLPVEVGGSFDEDGDEVAFGEAEGPDEDVTSETCTFDDVTRFVFEVSRHLVIRKVLVTNFVQWTIKTASFKYLPLFRVRQRRRNREINS